MKGSLTAEEIARLATDLQYIMEVFETAYAVGGEGVKGLISHVDVALKDASTIIGLNDNTTEGEDRA